MIKDDPSFLDGKYDESSDAFNHEAFANTIYKIIKENDPPLSIGLFGGWGVGKTSIVNLLKSKINLKDNIDYVYFNAWQYSEDSFRRQFLLTLVKDLITDKAMREYELDRLQKLNYAKTLEDSPGESIKELVDKARSEGLLKSLKKEFLNAFENVKLADIGLVRLLFTSLFFLAALGLFIIGLIFKDSEIQRWALAGFLVSAASFFSPKIENILVLKKKEVFDAKLIFPEQFEKEFTSIINKYTGEQEKVLIVIDDLDRCDYDTINSVLVTLKNYLNNSKTIFVVPMDDSSVVRIFKGENHNFGYEQLRKYFNISVRIPELHFDDLINFAEKIATQYNVPADVTFIAALGYCNDARKMKHFLNLYKVKEAIALERKDKGFLGSLELQSIKRQLAKIVVLEYQYPEVYRYLTKYPDKLEFLTNLAYSREKDDKINYTEINENYTQENFWNINLGLKDFLKKTNHIRFDDFETISKLKIPNQEKYLSKIGFELKKILESGEVIDFEKMDNKLLKENSSHIVQLLKKYLFGQISIVKERAFELSKLIISGKFLDDYYHRDLINVVINVICDNSNNLKLDDKFAVDILNNYENLFYYRKIQFTNKFEEDLFKQEQLCEKFADIVNHKYFEEIIKIKSGINQSIKDKLEKDITKLENNKQKEIYIREINQIKYSREERQKLNLKIPSPDIVVNAISYIPISNDKFNYSFFNSIKKLVLSKNNPFEFEEINTALSDKVKGIFNSNLNDNSFNDLLKNTSDLILDSPSYLEEPNAISISNAIKDFYGNFEEEAKQRLLLVYHNAIFSINKDSASKNQNLSQYNDFVDILSSENFKLHIEKLEAIYANNNENKIETIKSNIQRKWEFINSQFNSPNDNLINFTSYCIGFEDIITSENKKSLVLKILDLNDDKIILKWNDIITKIFFSIPVTEQIEIQNKLLSVSNNSSKSEEVRKSCFGKFLDLTEINNRENFKSEISVLIDWLAKDEDLIKKNNISDNIDKIIQIFGEDLLKSKVNDIMNDILEANNLEQFTNSTNACFKFKDQIRSHIWERIASKIEAEIYSESLSFEHKDALLEICKSLPSLSEYQRDKLSETLYYLKDSDQNDRIKTKAWEVYELLTGNNIINIFNPPPSEGN